MFQQVLTTLLYAIGGVFLLLLAFIVERYNKYLQLCKKYEHVQGLTQFLPPPIAKMFPQWLLPKGTVTNNYQLFSPDFIISNLKSFNKDYYKVGNEKIRTEELIIVCDCSLWK